VRTASIEAPIFRRSALGSCRSCARRSGSISIAKEGLEIAVEFLGEAFAAGVLRFGMESLRGGTEFAGVESVGAGGAVEQEAGEVGDFRAFFGRKRLAKFDDFHGFSAHVLRLAEMVEGASRGEEEGRVTRGAVATATKPETGERRGGGREVRNAKCRMQSAKLRKGHAEFAKGAEGRAETGKRRPEILGLRSERGQMRFRRSVRKTKSCDKSSFASFSVGG
jgi:hypothetical protein